MRCDCKQLSSECASSGYFEPKFLPRRGSGCCRVGGATWQLGDSLAHWPADNAMCYTLNRVSGLAMLASGTMAPPCDLGTRA
jgi:hypothetical protein